jgi:hypothetical protein
MVAKYGVVIVSAGMREWEEYTAQCWRTLGLCTHIDYDLIRVDNGGDNRGEVNFDQMVPYAEAANAGAALIRNDKLVILNNDITFTGDIFEKLDLYATPYCGAVSFIKEGVEYIEGWCIVIDRDLWHLVGGFNTVYRNSWEDVDLAWRLSRLGIRPCVIPIPAKHIWGATRSRYKGSNRWDVQNREYLLSRMREAKEWKWTRQG